jgi:hypothetical protein
MMKYITIVIIIMICLVFGLMGFYYFQAQSLDLTKPYIPEFDEKSIELDFMQILSNSSNIKNIESDIMLFLSNGSNIKNNKPIPESAGPSIIRRTYLSYIIDGSMESVFEEEQRRFNHPSNNMVFPEELDNKSAIQKIENPEKNNDLAILAALADMYKPKWDIIRKQYNDALDVYYHNCFEYNKNMGRCEYGWMVLGCIAIIYLLILSISALRKHAAG